MSELTQITCNPDADGVDEPLTWVSPGELDGFLYLDRNNNGVVDDGSELFGNATVLFDGSRANHGYQALAEFDIPENGGVADGVIDDADSVFSDLRVWIDANADGQFEAYESLSMSEAGVIKIELDFMELPRTDSYGNEFRYIGRAWIEDGGQVVKVWTTDVFFKMLDE